MNNKSGINCSGGVSEDLCKGAVEKMETVGGSKANALGGSQVFSLQNQTKSELAVCIKGLIDAGKVSEADVVEELGNREVNIKDENKVEDADADADGAGTIGERVGSSGAW